MIGACVYICGAVYFYFYRHIYIIYISFRGWGRSLLSCRKVAASLQACRAPHAPYPRPTPPLRYPHGRPRGGLVLFYGIQVSSSPDAPRGVQEQELPQAPGFEGVRGGERRRPRHCPGIPGRDLYGLSLPTVTGHAPLLLTVDFSFWQ